MFVNVLLLIVGMALLIKGADFFVDGAVNIAKKLKIPSIVIGLTLVSMGTSAPEASVSVISVINGLNDISVGNIVGSNIFNTLLILGVSSVIVPLCVDKDMKKFDLPIMAGIYAVMILFCFVITPYSLDLFEGVIMLAIFLGYTVFLVIRAKRQARSLSDTSVNCETEEKPVKPIWLSLILTVLGLAGIIFGGRFVVDSASEIALALGMSESLVGLTIVAVGTSLPELVTSITAAVKRENDIAIGNVVGSNIFNVAFILGLSSVIRPLSFSFSSLADILVMLVSGVLLLIVAIFCKKTKRWQGAIAVVLYAAYLTYVIMRN